MLVLLALGLLAALWIVLRSDNGHGGFTRRPAPERAAERRPAGRLRTVRFPACDGTMLEGWLVTPPAPRAPLVVMAPGLTGTKEGHLEPFAWRFAARGIAVLLFDYRTFGGSEGEPRHWVEPRRHAEDYEAALVFARGSLAAEGTVDGSRLALWGSSFSGGTVLELAAEHPELCAIVAQCPFLVTPPSQQPPRATMLRYVAWTMLDLLRARLAQLGVPCAPVYLPVFGQPGERAFARSRENPALDGEGGSAFWRTLPHPARGGWENKMLARMLATFDEFQPMRRLEAIRCPVHLVAAEHDDMVPVALVREAAGRLTHPTSGLAQHACGHFALYVGEAFADNVAQQADFLAACLGAAAGAGAAGGDATPAGVGCAVP